jgi:hypothetical protein
MTEKEWASSNEPLSMLEFVKGKASNRKLRLYAVACCRNVWQWIPEYSRKSVEAAERYADKQATRKDMSQAIDDILKDFEARPYFDGSIACAYYVSRWSIWDAVNGVLRATGSTPTSEKWLKAVNSKRKTKAIREAARKECVQIYKAQVAAHCNIARDIFSPFIRLRRNYFAFTPKTLAIAQSIYDNRIFSLMPSLADALQSDGCDNMSILNHCRMNKLHFRGCYVIDAILGKR